MCRWLMDKFKKKQEHCTNCGLPVNGSIRCRMIDRCIPSQNNIIWSSSDATWEEIVRSGKRIFVDSGRPLCQPCAEENGYKCYWCELESLEEKTT